MTGGRKAARYVVPVAVAGVAAATLGLVPALASSGDPDLPEISAQQLIEKIAASGTQQLSGSLKITTDLGLPSLGGLGGMAGGAFAPQDGRSGQGGGAGDSSADPSTRLTELASGTHTLRVAADGPDKQRVSILDKAAEYSLIRNGDQVWAYDSATNKVFHSTSPAGARRGNDRQIPQDALPATPKEFADQALKAGAGTTSVSVGGTSRIAGRDAYQLVIKPRQSGTTIGSIKVAVDAKNGTPLKFTLAPRSGGKAVVDVGFTKVDFAEPDASTFDFKPPKGAKVTQGGEHKAQDSAGALEDAKIVGKGWTSVAELNTGGAGMPAPKQGDLPPDAQKFLDSMGGKVTGKFGSGTVFKTRLVNALMTEDGKVYVGAVTQNTLVKAADQAK
jgi:outer membrane lipoprotein-sorting protein